MKTADEMRIVSSNGVQNPFDAVMSTLERGMERAAENNMFTHEAWLGRDGFHLDPVVTSKVLDALRQIGYRAVAEVVKLPNIDGEGVHFSISWRQ